MIVIHMLNYYTVSVLERTFLPRVFYVCLLCLSCMCFLCGWESSAMMWNIFILKDLGTGHLLFGDILPLCNVRS